MSHIPNPAPALVNNSDFPPVKGAATTPPIAKVPLKIFFHKDVFIIGV